MNKKQKNPEVPYIASPANLHGGAKVTDEYKPNRDGTQEIQVCEIWRSPARSVTRSLARKGLLE